jgi:hypothetical protein
MAITSKVEVCTLALGHLGNYGTLSNIDTPTNDKEKTFALWYDITRQALLKQVMPNFALDRRKLSLLLTTQAFGYRYAWQYPSDCLKVLGIADVDQVGRYIYSIEGNVIYSDDPWDDGLELRFVKDITDVNAMSPEFKILLSWALAGNTAMTITQSVEKTAMIRKQFAAMMSEASGLNAQENKPIRVSNSRFQQARYAMISPNPQKR